MLTLLFMRFCTISLQHLILNTFHFALYFSFGNVKVFLNCIQPLNDRVIKILVMVLNHIVSQCVMQFARQ